MSDAVAGIYSETQKTLQADVPTNGALVIVYNSTTKAAYMQPVSGDVRDVDNDIAQLNTTLNTMKAVGTSTANVNTTIVSQDDLTANLVADNLKKHDLNFSRASQNGSITLYLNSGNFVQEEKQEPSIGR